MEACYDNNRCLSNHFSIKNNPLDNPRIDNYKLVWRKNRLVIKLSTPNTNILKTYHYDHLYRDGTEAIRRFPYGNVFAHYTHTASLDFTRPVYGITIPTAPIQR